MRTLSRDISRRLAGLRRVLPRGDAGFSLIEALMAMTLFVIVATALVGLLSSAVAAHKLSRERTLAEQSVSDELEEIRRRPYDLVGLPNGNPPGDVPASQSISVTGLKATMTTKISYVTDPTPTSYANAANYKKVVVTLTRDRDSKQLTKQATYVAPPGRALYGGINNPIVDVQVIDYATNTAIPDATVNLLTGPSATRTDITDPSGSVTFPALTANPTSGPQAYYDLTTTVSGYQTMPEDLPPNAVAHVQLAPGQNFDTVLRVFKAATINVSVKNSNGTPFAGTATVFVGSIAGRQAQAFTVTGGSLSVTALNGEPIIPSLQYTVTAVSAGKYSRSSGTNTQTVPTGYPTNLTSTFTPTLSASAFTTRTLTVTVKNQIGLIQPGARVDVSAGPVPTFLTGIANGIGQVVFTIPSGNSYSVWARSGTLVTTPPVSVNVTSNTSLNVTVK